MRPRPVFTAAIAVAILLSFLGARQRAVRPVPAPSDAPTFNNEVVRIFQKNCQGCHHPGDIAPFSLMTYGEARPFASSIKFMTQNRLMPPWKAAAGCGDFVDPRVMSQQDIDTIARWVDAGAPEGNAADLPEPLSFANGWVNGEPDLVATTAEPYTPPARGDMYRCFVVPTDGTSDRWVSAIDVRPGDRGSVHHVLVFTDPTGMSETRDAADPGPGYQCFGGPRITGPGVLGGWAPGYRPAPLPEEVALKLPARARLVIQVHYHSQHSVPRADQTEVALYFAKKPPKQELRVFELSNSSFTIPPNHSNYEVRAEFTTPALMGARVWFVAPHMHLLGKSIRVEATTNGTTQCLVNVPQWDFNWQGIYRYKQPIAIPPVTRVSLSAFYDNSAENWRNPNVPPKPVSYGEATTDEMSTVLLGVTLDGEDLSRGRKVSGDWMRGVR